MARHWQGQGEKTCPADGPAPRARKAQSIGEAKKARPKQNQTKCTKKIVGTHKDGPIPYVGRMHVRDIHPQFSPWHMKLNLDSSTRCLPIGLWWALQGFKWLQKTRAESCWIIEQLLQQSDVPTEGQIISCQMIQWFRSWSSDATFVHHFVHLLIIFCNG